MWNTYLLIYQYAIHFVNNRGWLASEDSASEAQVIEFYIRPFVFNVGINQKPVQFFIYINWCVSRYQVDKLFYTYARASYIASKERLGGSRKTSRVCLLIINSIFMSVGASLGNILVCTNEAYMSMEKTYNYFEKLLKKCRCFMI